MRSFFKIFFASLLALVIFTVIGFFMITAILVGATRAEKPSVGENAVIAIDLSKQYQEQVQNNPLGSFVQDATDIPSLFDVVKLINYAASDNNVKGIYLKCNDNSNGFAASQEIRNALIQFKKSGKFVIAYAEVMGQKAYYVAAAANKVYTNPAGVVEWKGLASTFTFFKGTLDMLKVEPQIFYAGKFKSATEPFRETKMTDANKLQTSEYLGELYSNLLLAASQHTGKDTAYLKQLANNGSIQTAYDAFKMGLIDGVRYEDEIISEINQQLKNQPTDIINFVAIGKYAKAIDYKAYEGDKIAIIFAEGNIVDGKASSGNIASEEYIEIISKARTDNSIKAIVLRINSPGGSALASEVILRELLLAKKIKPVVVSFGDVAASGGYYIATGADSIFAQPTTITGSIGVFTIIPNFQQFFNDKLGVTFDRVKTGPYADLISVDRPLTSGEKLFIQNSIDTIYNQFKTRVSQGRKISMEMVDSIAQGRVWTGQKAVKIKLVDKLGNIQDAIDCAVRMAKVNTYRLKEYPEKKGLIESLVSDYGDGVKEKAIKEEIGAGQYQLWQKLNDLKGMCMVPQARLPFDINIR